jgi:cytoskeleton protein RodZ
MSSTAFGEHLKREREMRGVTLEEVSAATRISTRFLEALENEQWDRLPGGAFNRGFIRSVARFLGLDEESLVAEYALETKATVSAAAAAQAASQGMPRDWRPVIAAGVALIAVIAIAIFAIHRFHLRARAREQQQSMIVAPVRMPTGLGGPVPMPTATDHPAVAAPANNSAGAAATGNSAAAASAPAGGSH